MKKIIIISISVVVILFVLWKIASFKVFEVEENTLSTHQVKGKDYRIEIKYLASGATTTDVIQVRRVHSNGEVGVIKNIDTYNNLLSSDIVGDSVLRLVLSDTGYYKRGPDTLIVRF